MEASCYPKEKENNYNVLENKEVVISDRKRGLRNILLPNEVESNLSDSIIAYLFQIEMNFRASKGYIHVMRNINEDYRRKLVLWLYEVYRERKLEDDTFFRLVDILERYSQKTRTLKKEKY
jgi:hypothetical protein